MAEVFSSIKDHNHDFDWFACESKITVDAPDQGVSGKAYIRLRKDSIIWSVVKKLQLEGARTLITPEKYLVKYPIDNTYQEGSTKDVFAKLGVILDFADVQQAIFGNVIIPDSTDAQIELQGEHYILRATDQDLQLKYWVNAYTKHLDKVKMVDYRKREVTVSFSDYKAANNGDIVPYYRHFEVPNEIGEIAQIFLKIKKIEIDIPKKTRFSIPSRYERIY